MSEDKDTGSQDTPTGDAADQWLKQRNRRPDETNEEILDDPKKEVVRRLFHLGTRILETAGKIDWSDHTTLVKTSEDQLSCVRPNGQPEYISFSPFQRGQGVNLMLHNQEVDQIGLYGKDIFKNFQEFFGETSIYVVPLTSHEDHDPDKSLHTYSYALSADGECVRASWEGTFTLGKVEYTKEIDPGEIEMVGAAMNILRGQLEKFSPTVPV